jgi:hypothetical protein
MPEKGAAILINSHGKFTNKMLYCLLFWWLKKG